MKSKYCIVSLLLVATALTSCSRHEATCPVDFDKPDAPLLQKIALAAIAKRVPSMMHDRLKYKHTTYLFYRNHMFKGTNEFFSVKYGVENSMREVQRDGENVFEGESISVRVQPDGQIDKGGVSSNVTRYLTADLHPMRFRESHYSPVWGAPFYPVILEGPLRKPGIEQVESIALRAIARFLPAVPIDDLEFDRLSYFHGYHPDYTGVVSKCSVIFWQTSTVQERKTTTSVILEGQQVTVRIEPDGSVRKKGVNRSPLNFTMDRQVIEDIERKRQNKASENICANAPNSQR